MGGWVGSRSIRDMGQAHMRIADPIGTKERYIYLGGLGLLHLVVLWGILPQHLSDRGKRR